MGFRRSSFEVRGSAWVSQKFICASFTQSYVQYQNIEFLNTICIVSLMLRISTVCSAFNTFVIMISCNTYIGGKCLLSAGDVFLLGGDTRAWKKGGAPQV